MVSWRWPGAVGIAVLLAALALLWATREAEPTVRAARSGLELTGCLSSPVVNPTRFEARCTPLRFEATPTVLVAALDGEGCFRLGGLADIDYQVEIVLRSNPALVLARADYVRPGGDELVLTSDPAVFGPAASWERTTQ